MSVGRFDLARVGNYSTIAHVVVEASRTMCGRVPSPFGLTDWPRPDRVCRSCTRMGEVRIPLFDADAELRRIHALVAGRAR